MSRNDDGLGCCRGVRSAIPLAVAFWSTVALVGVFVAKLAGWM